MGKLEDALAWAKLWKRTAKDYRDVAKFWESIRSRSLADLEAMGEIVEIINNSTSVTVNVDMVRIRDIVNRRILVRNQGKLAYMKTKGENDERPA